MIHSPFSHHSCSVTRTREIKAAVVILIYLFSRVEDFQSTLKELKNILTLKHLWSLQLVLFFSFILMCQDVLAGVSQDSCLNSAFTGRNCSGAWIVSEAGRQGCGAGKTREGKFSQRAAAVIT